MTEYYGQNDYRDYLSHHGVVGMHWGIRRYQPYGIGYIRVGGKTGKEMIRSNISVHEARQREATELDRMNKLEIDPETGLRFKNKATSEDYDMKHVNPGFHHLSRSTTNNCMYCTAAYEMRRRGYDVVANRNTKGTSPGDMRRWFKKTQPVSIYPRMFLSRDKAKVKSLQKMAAKGGNKELAQKVTQSILESQPDGARGEMILFWSQKASHSVAYEVKNRKVIIRDCQDSTSCKAEDLVSCSSAVLYTRLDNLELNKGKIKEAVR